MASACGWDSSFENHHSLSLRFVRGSQERCGYNSIMILILCDDLIFTSKITATARAHHLTATAARTPTALLNKFNTGTACVLIDLHNPELKIAELVPMLRGINPSAKLIGFGSHVDVETLKAAREAGLDKVMPRSQFVNLLETELTAWATVATS
jgi:DNA-binding NarL/FixJ family response regulator